ncbi:MAG: [Fe-Fe] hydrogenase large subunit C-terminal domain-containing protein [Marinifilaceae bacterium]
MKEQVHFYHALKVEEDICIGCTHCMNICPTAAIRVNNGKATINKNACVDCGECMKSCPVNAIFVEQDDFSQIFKFKYRVALLPTVLLGQFPDEITEEQIFSVIHEMGFTHVYEVDEAVDILTEATAAHMKKYHHQRPFVSTFCPAVVRLIQVKFPSLVENMLHLKPVIDIAALYNRKRLEDEGIPTEDIGVFYVTPCAAKIAAVKSPVGEDELLINGVINMDFIYNKVLLSISQKKQQVCKIPVPRPLTEKSIGWTLTNGEASQYKGRCLAIDEIHNVIEILEKLENDEIADVDFLELRACDHSCAGGVLATENRFLTIERLRKRAERHKKMGVPPIEAKGIESYKDYLWNNLKTKSIEPRSIVKLDENMMVAMKKMEKVQRILRVLPGIDCGACGTPRCHTLAEDIVQGKAKMTQCVFLQKMLCKENLMTSEESYEISETTWGKKRFDKDRNKRNLNEG